MNVYHIAMCIVLIPSILLSHAGPAPADNTTTVPVTPSFNVPKKYTYLYDTHLYWFGTEE
jgi:hypothetical protein